MDNRNQHGFTLFETLVVLAIAGLIALFGAPALNARLDAGKVAMATQEIMMNLRWTRSMAIAHNNPIKLCPVDAVGQCTGFDTPNADWIAVTDGPNPKLLRRFRISDVITVKGPSSREGIRYQADGFSPGSTATLRICDTDGKWRRSIIMNNAGRARMEIIREETSCDA